MNARLRVLVVAAAVCALAPARAHAQAAQSHDSLASQVYEASQAPQNSQASETTPASRASSAGPRLELTATAVRRPAIADSAALGTLARKKQNMGQPVALMIVGGSAFLVGAIIGGDAGTIFMIGGAVTGLIGLYQYLQ